MDSSLSRGFWILHNNLFFPPFSENKFVEPGGKVWKETTIGDTTDNVFYICISAGSVISKNPNPLILNHCSHLNIYFFNYSVKKKKRV